MERVLCIAGLVGRGFGDSQVSSNDRWLLSLAYGIFLEVSVMFAKLTISQSYSRHEVVSIDDLRGVASASEKSLSACAEVRWHARMSSF